MDRPDSLSPRTCIKRVFIMVCLVSTCCSEADPSCTCTDIPVWPQTQPSTRGCFQIGSTFRYSCIDGYVRKAGTSNLIRCVQNKEWSTPTLLCIENPLNATQTTTVRTSTTTFPTSTMTPILGFFSSVSSETALASTLLPPQHTPGAPLATSALPQTSTNTSSPVSSSTLVTPERFHSTSSPSSPTTTHRSWGLDGATTHSSPSFNSTSSTLQGTDTVVTKVIAPIAGGIIVLAVIGVIWFLYRRQSRSSPQRNHSERPISDEESVPMQQNEAMI